MADLDIVLQRALATRINLQISISSIAAVEEWMDSPLTRWLDSIPLPPELPGDSKANFLVGLASDLSRLKWSAYGHPSGFVPKMSSYLKKCGIAQEDLNLINGLGEDLEPELVGSWIEVAAGEVRTGWQFNEVRPLAELEPHLGRQDATTDLLAWVHGNAIVDFRRFAQAIGKQPYSEIEFLLPGDDAASQVDLAAAAFATLLGNPLPDKVAAELKQMTASGLSLVAHISGGMIGRVALLVPSPPNDLLAKLCAAAGVDQHRELRQLQGMFGAEGLDRIEYRRHAQMASGLIDVHFVPGVVDHAPNLRQN